LSQVLIELISANASDPTCSLFTTYIKRVHVN